jgi:myo-inositol 2-dehydrogenase / D-chiro-inositol 1-dehydrogenase
MSRTDLMKTSSRALTRRTFLQRTATAAATAFTAPLIVPSSVLGGDGAVAPSNRITIGFIGTGRQSTYANIPGFLREADAQCVAVCDVDSWRMEGARQAIDDAYAKRQPSGTFKGCATFRDWRELLARKDIDAVMISTPDHWHVPMSLAALRAGKDVACEKPLTHSIAEGRLLSDLVKKTRRVFRTDSEFRSNRTMHRAAQLVRNGRIGKLQRIITMTPKDPTLVAQPDLPVPDELDYEMWQGPAGRRPYTLHRVHPRQDARGRPGWLCISDYADGMMANWGAHLNDIALWGADLNHTGPVAIEGTGQFPPQGNLWDVISEFDVTFTYANGVTLQCKTESPLIRWEGTEDRTSSSSSPTTTATAMSRPITPSDVRTPNIDRIGAEGMLVHHMRANCTVCSPSRAALLTGTLRGPRRRARRHPHPSRTTRGDTSIRTCRRLRMN